MQATCSYRARNWMDETQQHATTAAEHKPFRYHEDIPLSSFKPGRGLDGRGQAAEQCQQTFLVEETGQWKKRRPTCLCRQHDCPGVAQQRGTAFVVAKIQRMSTGVERFWHMRTGLELRMGVQTTNAKNGFQLAASAGTALRMHYKIPSCGKDSDMIVLRGCVSGPGCSRGNFLWVPTFRPVCAVDYVVTQY